MKIAIGSLNPVKINAVKDAFEAVLPHESWEIEAIAVQSEVSDQPMHDEETIRGAKNRAQKALNALDADFGVGLEGGLHKIDGRWFETGWCVILDKRGKIGIGSSIRLEVPKKIMDLIEQGKELGDAADIIFKTENIKQKEGFFGIMTNLQISRKKGYGDGVISALAPFYMPDIFLG